MHIICSIILLMFLNILWKRCKIKMNLQEMISASDMILIGIGEDFQEKFEKLEIPEKDKNTIFEKFFAQSTPFGDMRIELYPKTLSSSMPI